MARIITEVKRECGFRHEGGFYFKTVEGSENGILDPFVVINPPVPTQRSPHRGPILVDGHKILSRLPEDEWVVGSSAKTVERKRSDEFWVSMFGMPLAKRLGNGDCADSLTAEDAYAHLLDLAQWGSKVEASMRVLALGGVLDLPRMAEVYAKMERLTISFALRRDPADLVKLGAAAWEMYYRFHPTKRKQAAPLATLLASLGFVKDGREMLLSIHQS